MTLSTMLQDYTEANDAGKQDMFEEAAERMITAGKAIAYKDEVITKLQNNAHLSRTEIINIRAELAAVRSVLADRDAEVIALRLENDRLREALKWYAECTWHGCEIVACTTRADFNLDWNNGGDVAAAALLDGAK